MKYTRNLLLQSMHKDWYVCQTKTNSIHENTDLMLDFYNGEPDVLNRCTFLFHPIAQNEDKYKMCTNVLGPVKHPAIAGQPLPHPPHLVPETPPSSLALPSCIPVCPAATVGGTAGEPAMFGPSVPLFPGPSGTTGVSVEPSVATAASRCLVNSLLHLQTMRMIQF